MNVTNATVHTNHMNIVEILAYRVHTLKPQIEEKMTNTIKLERLLRCSELFVAELIHLCSSKQTVILAQDNSCVNEYNTFSTAPSIIN